MTETPEVPEEFTNKIDEGELTPEEIEMLPSDESPEWDGDPEDPPGEPGDDEEVEIEEDEDE